MSGQEDTNKISTWTWRRTDRHFAIGRQSNLHTLYTCQHMANIAAPFKTLLYHAA